MDSNDFFSASLPATLAADGGAFRGEACWVIRLSGEGGGEWTVDLRAVQPSVRAGAATDATHTIELERSTFEAVLSDPKQLFPLYFKQQIRVSGDVQRLAAPLANLIERVVARAQPFGGLQMLVAPTPVEKFLRDHWPERPFVSHGDPARLRGITDLPQLRDAHALLAAWEGTVGVFRKTSADEFDAPKVPPDVAGQLFDKGFALVFGMVEDVIPELRGYLARLQAELALPARIDARCLAYATAASSGASPHFDANANIVIQLTGEKVWHVAPNHHVERPTSRYSMSSGAISQSLRRQMKGDAFPTQLPADAEAIHLRPGSVLVLPRAWWHTTSADQPSLSLNFTFSQPTWAEQVSHAVLMRLLDDPAWRALATGASSAASPEWQEEAKRTLAQLLPGLAERLSGLSPDEVLAAVAMPTKRAPAISPKQDWLKMFLPESK